MANNSTPNDNRFKPALVAPAQDPHNFNIEDLDKRLKLAQLLKLEKQLAEEAEAEKQLIAARQAGIDSVKLKMAMEKVRQDGCAHRKENGNTHLAGQKDHSGTLHLICQGCQKVFVGNQVPNGLMPQQEGMIGGPNA